MRPGPFTVLPAVVWLVATAPAARAQVDTLDFSNSSLGSVSVASVPVDDIVPPYGVVHVAWTRGPQLRHAWKEPGSWQTETVVDSARGMALAVHGDGSAVVSFTDFHGHLICGERVLGSWALDTVVTSPGSNFLTSLALDPEPVIAWVEVPASGTSHLRTARRSGGSWTIVDLDQGAFLRPPSVAIGPEGKRGIAAGRSNGSYADLVWYEAATPGGPFTPAVLDTDQFLPVSAVWDAPRDRPMLFYGFVGGPSEEPGYRFTWRDVSGSWQRQDLGTIAQSNRLVGSLALDPVGAPGAFWEDFQYILQSTANGAPRDEVNDICGSTGTGFLRLSTQRGGAPGSAFSSTFWGPSYSPEWTSSGRAVASHQFGVFDMVWREPLACLPQYLFYREAGVGDVTAVPSGAGPQTPHLTLAPNPLGAEQALRVRGSLPRRGDVRIDAHDLAGRRVASLGAGRLAAGTMERTWRLDGLSPGVYWVSIVLDGERIARSVLVRR